MLSKSFMPKLRNMVAARPAMVASHMQPSLLAPQQRGFSTLNLHSSQKQISVRIGKVKRNFFGFIIIVPEQYAIMVHRLKRFHKQLEPGINFVVPFVDTVEFVHDLREQAFEVSSQVAVTKDNVQLKIDGVLYVQVVDPYAASYGVERYFDAVQNLAQTTMRSEIGKLNFDKLFEERETLNERIVKEIEEESMAWGVHSIRYEIKDIEAPTAIQKAMVLQAEAERRKRASILASEGEMTANINLANAEKQAQILEAEGKAEAIILKAKAQGDALKSIEEALKSDGGQQAAQFIIGQRFIQVYRGLASKNNTLIMPSQPQKIAQQIESSMKVLS